MFTSSVRQCCRSRFCECFAIGVALTTLAAAALFAPPARGTDTEDTSVAADTAQGSAATAVLGQSGVRGGLLVHVSCGDGILTAALADDPRFLVQGLETDQTRVAAARAHLASLGRYGRVSVAWWNGQRLPYADGIVNLLVVEQGSAGALAGDALKAEARRVLAPRGVLLVRDEATGAWQKAFVQPVPQEIDEWSHYRHDPANTNVAQDTVVDSPRSIKWVAGPEMSRHHDHLPSLNAMVTSGGRMFYVFDEGPHASIMLPPRWRLVARDAFSGVLLWKKDIERWAPHLWPLKSMPATLPRRLVAAGEQVFVTLGIDAPVSLLDAADGAEIRVFEGSQRTEEILVKDSTLLALRLTGEGPFDQMDREAWGFLDGRVTKFPYAARLAGGVMSPLWLHAKRRLIAYDVESGNERWRFDGTFAPLSLATDGKRVCFHDGQRIVALDFQSGRKLWQTEPVPVWKEYHAWYGASLVLYDDVVLFSGGENMTWHAAGTPRGAADTMTAFSAADGRKLWSAAHPPSGYRSPEDLYVAQGLVWAPNCTHASQGVLQGLDPHTGKVVREFEAGYGHGFHHRCYPGKATERYMMISKVGINLISFSGDRVDNNQWVRGACGYGFMPGNGMIYATPDPCNCYPEAKLNGFAALAPEVDRSGVPAGDGFQRGGAFEAIQGARVVPVSPSEWPIYRHDAARSGVTSETVAAQPATAWQTRVGRTLSAPVVAGERVFVSSIEEHAVVALDAQSGRQLWRHTAGARVDSAPTIVRVQKHSETTDLAVFGSADGWVYCVRAADGELVWRRRLAPTTEQIVAADNVESLWPVHGSVLYYDGLIYAAAGRSTFVDGGLYLHAIEPVSGRVKVCENRGFADQTFQGMNTQPSKPDVLAARGDRIFMRSLALDLALKPAADAPPHIFAPNGLLDDSWFHRAFWVYGRGFAGGCGGFGKTGNSSPSGRIMVADGARIYGFGRTRYGWGSAFEYRLYAVDVGDAGTPALGSPTARRTGKKGAKRANPRTPIWSVASPILVRAMVKAGDELLMAGPPKLYEELEAIQQLDQPDVQERIEAQARALHDGAQLHAVSASDGRHLRKLLLNSLPVGTPQPPMPVATDARRWSDS